MSDKLERAPLLPASGARAPQVCVAGNLTIDIILRSVSALPEWGQEVVGSNRSEVVAGQAGYLAFCASRLGLATSVVCPVGDDPSGERIRSELRQSGVDDPEVETISGAASPLTLAVVRPDGERAFISDFGCLDRFDVEFLTRHLPATRGLDAVALVGTLNLPRFDHAGAVELLGRARPSGALTLLDTGWDPGGWQPSTVAAVRALLAEVDLFIPNLDEAAALTGTAQPLEALRDLGAACAGTVVIKGGAEGSWALDSDGQLLHVPAQPVRVDNAVGAGDTYNAGFLAGYLPGRELPRAMAYATATAALYVSRHEERFPTLREVEAHLPSAHRDPSPAPTAG